MSHVLEHLPHARTGEALRHVYSWLRPGGTLTVEVPDMDAILALGTGYPPWAQYIYGSQDHEGEYHKAGFTAESLRTALRAAGFAVMLEKRFLSDHPMRPGFPCLQAQGTKETA